MPTYQYACTECGHQLEAVQSFTDDPLTVCPSCDGKLRKQFGSVGIVFKGPGFYRTDSRNGASGDGANGNGKAESKDGGSKSDSKDGGKAAGSSEKSPEKSSEKSEKKSADKTTAAAAA